MVAPFVLCSTLWQMFELWLLAHACSFDADKHPCWFSDRQNATIELKMLILCRTFFGHTVLRHNLLNQSTVTNLDADVIDGVVRIVQGRQVLLVAKGLVQHDLGC